jgi:hypothetical protein
MDDPVCLVASFPTEDQFAKSVTVEICAQFNQFPEPRRSLAYNVFDYGRIA